MRGQAELVSTVIMVGLALIVALGVVYYFTPLVAGVSASSQLRAKLASAAASVDASVPVLDASGASARAVAIVRNAGDTQWRTCLSVIAFDADGLPAESVDTDYYLFTGSPAWMNAAGGWTGLEQLAGQGGDYTVYNAPARHVYMMLSGEHVSLAGITGFASSTVEIACLDTLAPGATRIVRLDIPVDTAQGEKLYALVILVVANNSFYEVKRVPLG